MESQGKTFHQLCLCGRIIVLECKRSLQHMVNERNTSEILFCSLLFNQEENNFIGTNDVTVIDRKSASDFNIVTCKSIYDFRKRVTAAYILLKMGKEEENFKYILGTLNSSFRLETQMEFKLPYQLREKVSILPGPIICWSHAGVVFYTSLQEGDIRQIPKHVSHTILGVLPVQKGDVFIIGLQTPSEECKIKNSNATPSSQSLGYFLGRNGHIFDANMILPHAYICITQCILVLSAEKVHGLWKSSVVAATCKKQLVYFENGIPKDFCQLPFDGPEYIHMVDTGRNGCLITISFDQGHVCAIWRDTFQVAAQWSGVSFLHVDDFLGCGTEQLLLVFEDDNRTGHPLDNFLITDLCGITCSADERKGLDTAPHPAGENYLQTFQALESRLQSGLTVLQELQSDARVKDRVLLQSVQALTDIVSGRDPDLAQYEQEGLFSLWDEMEEPKTEACDDEMQVVLPKCCTVSSKPQVEKLWHRFLDNHLVVGVILNMDNSIPVDSVSLSILTNTGLRPAPAVIQTQSQVFRLPSSSLASTAAHPEPAAKRSRGDDGGRPGGTGACRLAVTAATELTSLLNCGRVKCPVMLHYVQRQKSSALVDKLTQVVFQCGQVPTDIPMDLHPRLLRDPKLTTDAVREDMLSALAALDRWVFRIDSAEHSLGDVETWIQRAGRCERLEVSPQYLVSNSVGPSALMLLRWRQTSLFRGELSVHSSRLQMLQFLDSLCSFLPASCAIQPLKETGDLETSHILSLSLENEALSLKEGVSALLRREEREGGSGHSGALGQRQSSEPGSADERQRCRQEWERDLERSRKRLSPLVDVAKYRSLTQSLSKVQLEADIATLLQTRKAL